jgi:hypothetical protein
LPQVFREEAKPVWLSTSVIGGDHCRRFYASVFRRAVEGVGHAQAQGPAWPSAVALVSVFRPGHRDPLPDLCASMLCDRWEGVQKPWEKSHAG